MESTCRQLKSDEAKQQLRMEVSKALCEAKSPKQNIEKQLRCAITNLRKDESIVILPVDKGNATVIMDKEDYRSKILDMLKDPTYKKLKCDPTTKNEKRITQSLKEAEKNEWIPDNSASPPSFRYHPKSMACRKSTRPEPPTDQSCLPLGHRPTSWQKSWLGSWHC